MTPAIYSPQMLEELSQGLNYYSGDDDMYNAAGYEEMLDFAGASAPTLTTSSGDRVIKINIDNNDTSNSGRFLIHAGHRDRELRLATLVAAATASGTALTGAALSTIEFWARRAGLITDGSFTPINPQAGQLNLTANSSGAQSIRNVLAYLRNHPTPITAIDIVSDSDVQLSQVFTVRTISPFKEGETRYLDPTKATDQNTFQSKRAKFNTSGLVLDQHCELEYAVMPNTNVTISLYCGASLSTGHVMRNAVNKAIKNRPGRR